MTEITIVYDNRASEPLRPGFGFSAFIRTEGATVLLDAGADKMLFEHNAAQLGIPLDSVAALVVSHDHCDHMGAMTSVFHSGLDFYIPKAVAKRYERIGKGGIRFHAVKDPVDIIPGVRSIGQMGKQIPEQAILVDGKRGPVLITGCAHMGVEHLVARATQLAGQPPELVVGGFHLFNKELDEVERTIAALESSGIHRIAPCHCTGDEAIAAFERIFGDRFVTIEAGSRIVV